VQNFYFAGLVNDTVKLGKFCKTFYLCVLVQPDLSAPGIDIIAAWTMLSSPTGNPKDSRMAPYNIISGTSMACPHASGAAAYVKSFRRDWSPAMIMSALITTGQSRTELRNFSIICSAR